MTDDLSKFIKKFKGQEFESALDELNEITENNP